MRMGYRTGNHRPSFKGRRLYPAALGARHRIQFEPDTTQPVSANGVETLLGLVHSKWSKLLPPKPSSDRPDDLDYRQQFAVYQDPKRIGMTVLERRVSARQGRDKHIWWSKDDVGRIRRDIADEISRLDLSSEAGIEATLTQIVRVSEAGSPAYGRKLAAIVEQSSSAAELLVEEHDIITRQLERHMGGLDYPAQDYVPNMIIGRIDRAVSTDVLDKCVVAAQSLLPVTVRLEPISFFTHQEIS